MNATRRTLLIGISAVALTACSKRPAKRPPVEPEPAPEAAPVQPEPVPEIAPPPEPIPLPKPKPSNFPRSLANVLVSEGGNDDDPRDHGGRTSRGIIQREWTKWRKTHCCFPADVWKAPQGQIEAIYRAWYWDVMRCEELPLGVDYSTFDPSVNSGPARGGYFLRRSLGLPTDNWHVTDEVLRAIKRTPTATLIVEINDRRLRWLKGLSQWPIYGKGWGARVVSVKHIALRMADPAVSLFDIPDKPEFGPGKAY